MESKVRVGLMTTCLVVFTMGSMPNKLYAGDGTFKDGKYNFCASIRFNATSSDIDKIKEAFQNGSQILADATDGQQRFDTITLVNNSGASQSAEYWVHAGSGRAYATQGKYGVRGEHINMYFDSNFQKSNGADGDAYTVAHEHAHHSFGVLDEYSGPSGNAECAPPPDTATLNFSLMDNYFTRGGNATGSNYTLNEFCVLGNHDPDHDTWQYSVHKESAWETIASHPKRAATAPSGLPTDAPPAAHTVNFKTGTGGLGVMLVLDRSGSMNFENRMAFAKSGANVFIDQLAIGDEVGVASFSSSASVNYSISEIIDASIKAAAKATVNALSAGGSTNIGSGLSAGLNQIVSRTQRSCDEIIVLLSDGDHNTGTPPGSVIPALQAEGVTVLTVGVGSGISASGQATLQSVATQTGGKYYRVANSFDLVGLFLVLAAESSGDGLLSRSPLAIGENETLSQDVLIEPGVSQAKFAIAIADVSDDIQLTLVSPTGHVIDPAEASSNPDINYSVESNSQIYTIDLPESGTWVMTVTSGVVNNGQFEALAFASHDGVQLTASLQSDSVVFPTPVIVNASPMYEGEVVVGASVTGNVVRPDGSSVAIVLYDDGDPAHGDTIPADGIYAAKFNQFNEDGTYTFELKSENISGKTYAGEDLFSFDPSSEKTIPTFVRLASASAIVTGVPDYVSATVEYGPETINLKSKGKFVTAYIELPDGYNVEDIELASLAITAIDGSSITPIKIEAKPTSIGDFDNDGNVDLMVKFSRKVLQDNLTEGVREIQLEGEVAAQLLIGVRSVNVINPGK